MIWLPDIFSCSFNDYRKLVGQLTVQTYLLPREWNFTFNFDKHRLLWKATIFLMDELLASV